MRGTRKHVSHFWRVIAPDLKGKVYSFRFFFLLNIKSEKRSIEHAVKLDSDEIFEIILISFNLSSYAEYNFRMKVLFITY